MSEWKEEPLERLYEFCSGLSKPRAEFGSGYPFLSFKDVFYNFFVPDHLTELVNSTEQERQRCSIGRGDVFLTRTSETMDELAMSCVALKDIENATFNGFTKRLRPRSDADVLPEYAGFFFRSPRFRREVTAMSSLSTRASLNNEMLARLTITIPPMAAQRAIARVLGTLDDKIEMNRRMNETLEAIARAVFKSWFVDFDPVRAKAEGRDTGLPPQIAELFPDRFEDSELGPIPEAWRVAKLGELIDLQYGKALRAQDRNSGNVPVYGSNGRVGWHDEALASGPGIVVGRKGNPGTVTWAPEDFFPIDTTFFVVPKAEALNPYFLLYALTAQKLGDLAADSAVPGLNRNQAYMSLQLVPSAETLDAFRDVASLLLGRVHAKERESATLAGLRDALLPKLISGEIRVKEAETSRAS